MCWLHVILFFEKNSFPLSHAGKSFLAKVKICAEKCHLSGDWFPTILIHQSFEFLQSNLPKQLPGYWLGKRFQRNLLQMWRDCVQNINNQTTEDDRKKNMLMHVSRSSLMLMNTNYLNRKKGVISFACTEEYKTELEDGKNRPHNPTYGFTINTFSNGAMYNPVKWTRARFRAIKLMKMSSVYHKQLFNAIKKSEQDEFH